MNRLILNYIFCLLAAIFFSCSEDFENFDNKAFLDSDAKLTTYLIQTDIPEYHTLLNVRIARPATEDLEFILEADNSLLQTYNNSFSENAIILPAIHYSIAETNVWIAEESVRSTDIQIDFNDIDQLDRNLVYVLPVSITSDDIELLESARIHYFVFRGGALVNWAADIEGNYLPVNWSNNSLITQMTEVTIEGLLYLRQTEREGSDSNIMTFFGTENSFLIRLGDTFDAGQIMVVKNGSGKYPDNANDRTKAPVGRWFHLAVTHNSENMIRIYVDGVLMSTTAAASGTFSLSNACHIGKSYNDNRYWPGLVTETRVWNIVRTQEEIAENMYTVDPNSDGLIGYWKFDEGSGDTVADHTSYNTPITANSTLIWTSISLPE